MSLGPWRCSSHSQQGLVANLQAAGIVSSDVVRDAMNAVDRGHFTKGQPYADAPQPIGYGATISAPHMHGEMLERVVTHLTGGGKRALDVGSGSGYLAAVMAVIMSSGLVVGIEHIPELAAQSVENIKRGHADLIDSGRVVIKVGDGRLGAPEHGPFDVIHVGAAAKEVPPALRQQLAIGGRMIIPVGEEDAAQYLMQIDRISQNEYEEHQLTGVIFVPLTSAQHQLRRV